MSASFVLAMLAGLPAVADDTELLLLNPDPSQNPKPNVMFILDSSGSMTTGQDTIEPYDSTETYGGDCDPDKYYWTDVDVLPDCSTSNNVIDQDKYVCEFSRMQIDGIGSYTDTMIQYRDGPVIPGGPTTIFETWQTLAPGYSGNFVECQADSGTHGENTGDPEVYAAAGIGLGGLWTDDPDLEVSWGSSPRNVSYTVYKGNYLNWKDNPNEVNWSRNRIMREVAKKVLNSVNNLNVGLMRFDGNDGGPVILDITDLDSNRQDVIDAIDAITAGGNTPLSETLYESALYWTGQPAHFGTAAFTNLTDPDAFISGTETYEQPEWDVCAKNYNVLLTDGAPVQDFDTPGLINNLPDFAATVGATCDGTGDGFCLDDVAQYLSARDLDPVEPGDQFVNTFTIGFNDDLNLATTQLLTETAADSGGQYYLASDVETLTKTLLSIIANINDRTLSFSAPAVSVNTFNRTQNLNDLYITTFGARARVHWPGNLKKYRIEDSEIVDANGDPAVDPTTGFFADTSTSIWTVGPADGNDVRLGGAANQLPDPSVRNLYTNNSGTDLTAGNNQVSPGNMGAFTPADFGLTGANGEPDMEELIDWARGEDTQDEDINPMTTVRNVMGDPLHSQPAAIVYGGTVDNPEVVVYTATNDGYLHAIDGATGEELWAFIPKQLLANLTRLYFDPGSRYKNYGLDGNVVPIIKDVDRDGTIEPGDGDFVQIIFGMRRGGNTYFSLDVTNRYQPELLWTASLPEFGETWSTPAIARMNINSVAQNVDKAVVVIGGGYDTVHDTATHPASPDAAGASIHFLDLRSGQELWRAGPDNGADLQLATMTRAIPNDVRVIDMSGDGLADRMYATDMGGQIWRFDIFNGQAPSSLVTGGVIAQFGAEGSGSPDFSNTRRFYNAPDVALVQDPYQQRRYISVSVGSGYRAHPFDLRAADRFFSLRDPDVLKQLSQTEYDNYIIATEADLVEVSGQTQTVVTANDRGWKFTLPPNEKVLSTSLTFDDEIFFVAFTPDSNAAQTCAAGQGTNFLYRMSAINGDPIVPNIDTLDPNDADDERKTTLQQGGIAPSPTILFPTPPADCTGDDCKIPPLGCVGVECFDPGFRNDPKRTLWVQDGIE